MGLQVRESSESGTAVLTVVRFPAVVSAEVLV